jgi:hypothetical protein
MSAEYPHDDPWQPAPEQSYPVMPPQSSTPQPAVVWLPPVANDRTNFALIGAFSIALSTIFIPQGIADFVDSHSPLLAKVEELMLFYLPPLLLIVFGILAINQERRWNVVNQRRQMAAAWGFASGIPLAEPYPFSTVGALPPHFTVHLKTNWIAVFALTCLVACILLLIWLYFSLTFALLLGVTFQESMRDGGHFSFFPLIPLIFAPALVLSLVRSSLPQRIEITTEGMAVRDHWAGNGRKKVILWHEARLFALREGKPGAFNVRYELSSPTTVVTFSRILRPHRWSRFRPAQPFGEYNAQMDALLALISASTGLPLYDVRQAPRTKAPSLLGSPANTSLVLSGVLVGLSFYAQVEGFPGVLFAKVHNDGRPVVLVIEIIAGILALASLWFGYRVPGNQARFLIRLGYVILALAIIGLVLFPFGPFVH